MMIVRAAALLVATFCCSAAVAVEAPPTLEVLSAAGRTLAGSDTATVPGVALDQQGPGRLTVGGVEVTPGADGSSTATVPVAPGVHIIETHAIDKAGNDVRDVRAVLAG